jgi:hypothetical protein
MLADGWKPGASRFRVLIFWLVCFVLLFEAGEAFCQVTQRLHSRPRPGEIDTAAEGGQAGGIRIGRNYRLADLRCGAGEAIVGARIRRGDVLDYIQIACARPTCSNRGCSWSSSYWGASAGNRAGGDPHPEMVCSQNEMVSGFRARVVTFTVSDFAADIEIECTPMTSAPTARGFFPAGQRSRWHQPEGALRVDRLDGLQRGRAVLSPVVSCRAAHGFGATAISVGVADFVNSRVVQAVSLYCPAGQPGPRCPDTIVIVSREDQYYLVRNRWFPEGGRTGGGAMVEMRAFPESENWERTQVTETVRLRGQTCNLNNAPAICGTGGHRVFDVGTDRDFALNRFLQWRWDHPRGGQHRNSFPDLHFVCDNGPGGAPAQWNLLDHVQGGRANTCTITCEQTYSCGRRTYGPFEIVYAFTRDVFVQRRFLQPTVQANVTRVTATKR